MYLRVCAAIIKNGSILMVQHQHDGRSYWTLPGGGIEPNETLEDAVIREVQEETNLQVHVDRLLFIDGNTTCFLALCDDGEARLGYDPELSPTNQMITALAWFPLEDVANDFQVCKVLEALADTTAESQPLSEFFRNSPLVDVELELSCDKSPLRDMSDS